MPKRVHSDKITNHKKTSHFSLLTSHFKVKAGFTLIELVVVMGIFAIMVGFASINLIHPQTQASLDTTLTSLVSDLKEQQIRAMTGDDKSAYGVHITANNYTLFTGSSYSTGTEYFTVSLNSGLSISTPSDIIFAQRSGETTQATFTLTNSTSSESKTIIINTLGAIKIQ
jgi:prepilin-type N-terminal cleavage/methylation domain-containing protein